MKEIKKNDLKKERINEKEIWVKNIKELFRVSFFFLFDCFFTHSSLHSLTA